MAMADANCSSLSLFKFKETSPHPHSFLYSLPFPSSSSSSSSSYSRRQRPPPHNSISSKRSDFRRNSSNVRQQELEAVPQRRLKDDKDKSNTSQSSVFKSLGSQKKNNKGLLYDLKDSQVDPENLQDVTFLNAVVKVYCTHTAPDYSLPWQKQRQYTSTGSAFMIGDGKLLTNAHCVEHDTQVKVKRRGDDTKFVAKFCHRYCVCQGWSLVFFIYERPVPLPHPLLN